MKFYQIKSTEKGSSPARWYRLLAPSGITFSQLYVLLAYIHGELDFLSLYFDFETKDRQLIIEEFENGEPEYSYTLYDKYDSAGTYIDTFFEEGFRISLYSGTDLDLTIVVEKAVEIEGLASPKVIKVSRAVAETEGGQPGGGALPEELFLVEPSREHDFVSAEELAERISSGRGNAMHVSVDPVTPEESIRRGKKYRSVEEMREIMMPLYEDEDIGPLFKAMDDQGTDESSDPFLKAKLNNIMIVKYGEPLSSYVSDRLFERRGPELSELIASMKAERYSQHGAESLAGCYAKEDLQNIAADYGVKLPPRATAKTMAKKLATPLFSVEGQLRRMLQLDDDEMELLRHITARDAGWYPETEAEEESAEGLQYMILAFRLKDGRMYAPDEVRRTIAANWNETLEIERQKRVWLKKCLETACAFYGVMTWDILGKLFARRFKNVDSEELKMIFRETPEYMHDFIEHDGRLMLRGYEEDEYYKYLENVIQGDKPFYIPSRREIEELADKGCLLSSRSHQAMYRFLIRNLSLSPELAELQVAVFYEMINNESGLQDALDSVAELLGEEYAFQSEDDFAKFAQLYMDMNNFSHLQSNRGYTPNDIFNMKGGAKGLPKNIMISPGDPESAVLLDQARDELSGSGISLDETRVQEMLSGEKRKKIGRNEPCPCGSGKKYKNCCGK